MTTNTHKNRFRRLLESAFFVAGISALSIWGWSVVNEGIYEDWNNWTFEQNAHGQSSSVGAYLKQRLPFSDAASRHTASPDPAAPEKASSDVTPLPKTAENVKANQVIGRVLVPRLNLKAIVREGTSERTLSLASGHVAGTALPGQNGNVAIAAHRDTLFRGLKDIKTSDQIVFENSSGDRYVYQVTGTQIVKPTQVSVLNVGLYPELTLITCYPFNFIGSAPYRFIVKARQIAQHTGQSSRVDFISDKQDVAPPPLPAKVPAPEAKTESAKLHKEEGSRIPFEVSKGHSRQLTEGISISLTNADKARGVVNGWMWVMPDRRTIWLRDQTTDQPTIFTGADGVQRKIVISSVSENSMRGYLIVADSSAAKTGATE